MNKKRKVLVTGANGLIGGRIAELADSDFDIITMSKTMNEWVDYVVDFKNAEEITEVLNLTNPDVIINAGGITSVEYAEINRAETTQVNVDAVRVFVRWCEERDTRLIQFSTDFVFNGTKDWYCESDIAHPLSHYGQSKLKSEEIALNLGSSVVIRTSLVYGLTNHMSRLNFPLWIFNELTKGNALNITADQFRSPTFVDDLAYAAIDLIEHSFNGIIHLAGSKRLNVYDFALETAELFCLNNELLTPINTDYSGQNVKRPMSTGLNNGLALAVIGYNPRTPKEGLKQIFKKLNTQEN